MDFPPWPIPEWSWIIPTHSSEGLFCSPGPTRCWGNAPGCVFLMSVLGRVLSGRRQAAAPGFQGGWQAAGRQRNGRIDGSCWTPRSSPHPSSSYPTAPPRPLPPSSTPRPSFLRAHHLPQRVLVSGNWFLWPHLPCGSEAPHPSSPPKEEESWTDKPAHASDLTRSSPVFFSLGLFLFLEYFSLPVWFNVICICEHVRRPGRERVFNKTKRKAFPYSIP